MEGVGQEASGAQPEGEVQHGYIFFSEGSFWLKYETGQEVEVKLRAAMLNGISVGSISVHEKDEKELEAQPPPDLSASLE